MPDIPSSSSPPWHALPADEVLARLDSGAGGLTPAEADRRLARYGPNSLSVRPPVPAWTILVAQFRSLIVLLLVVAAALAFAVGDHLEALAIWAVLALNVAIGFAVELRARRAMDALGRLQVQGAVALRGGEEVSLDARSLVPGDIVLLEAGAAIPADARLLAATELTVVEAPLTGESVPVHKGVDPGPEDAPVAERAGMVFKGTVAAAGSGRAVVVATGGGTEIGRISELVQHTRDDATPLEERLDVLGRRLIGITLVVAAAVATLGWVRGEDVWLMAKTGIALAIAAIPEGLPVVATVTLALGMRRMAQRHALVRRLPAVETLGSATVICADKTGTLTAARMTVTHIELAGGAVEVTADTGAPIPEGFLRDGTPVEPGTTPGLAEAIRIGVLVNRARLRAGDPPTVEGDPTEGALLLLGRRAGMTREALLDRYPEVAEIPFSSERMWMATFHREADGRVVVLVKGAPQRVVEASSHCMEDSGLRLLDAAGRQALLERNAELGGRGLRVLALARRELPPEEVPGEDAFRNLTFVGYVGMIDPPAPGVEATIGRLRAAGIRTVMITGDQAVTARAVALELGVLADDGPGGTLEGRRLSELPDDRLAGAVEGVSVFSRVSPRDKLRIVQALQDRGEVVGMLGDGVNDAPALKRADIGVAMGGRGTDVAKETADVVLQDDRFESVGAAVEEGRIIFDNIRKYIFFLFSCNLSEVLVVLAAGVAGLPLPLLPLQILWLNLVTDVFPALALAVEPAEPDVMRRPPRDPDEAILSRGFLAATGGYALLMTGVTLGAFTWALQAGDPDPRHAVTVAFMTLALAQLLHVFNARGADPVLLGKRLFENGWVWGAVALTVGLQLLAVYLPGLSDILGTRPLDGRDWAVVAGASVLPLLVGQGLKAWRPG